MSITSKVWKLLYEMQHLLHQTFLVVLVDILEIFGGKDLNFVDTEFFQHWIHTREVKTRSSIGIWITRPQSWIEIDDPGKIYWSLNFVIWS